MNSNLSDTQKRMELLKSDKKYQNGRNSLLLVVILSLVNILTITFADTFFYFSSYLSQLIPIVGISLKEESGLAVFVVAAAIISVALLIPYLVCFFLSKKHYGWMIGALVMFSLDTIILLFDLLGYIGTDLAITYVANTAFHIYVLVILAAAVKNGVDLKKREAEVAEIEANQPVSDETSDVVEEVCTEYRNVTITRGKAFVYCAVKFAVCVDGKPVDYIKNGETKTISVDIREHALTIVTDLGHSSETLTIPSDFPCAYNITVKVGPKIILTNA